MNTPADDRGLDWRAIAAGAGATLALGFSVSYLMRPLYAGIGMQLAYGTMIALSGLVALTTHVLGGAIAGLLAKRRGAVHGALAMLLASALGFVVTVVMLTRQGGLPAATNLVFWFQWLLMAVLCFGAGTVAGYIAARIAAAKPSP
jgi:hypothetical protein